ncbi:N-acetylmuramoyl-L-alanine amidase [Chengkuizengella sp. SCS-71B]|uniref:N-acetylmuramoyl-L-alanine amidase n=1 Tax=Chengkuizengella sp. SCS-71B TaxID=3115290 RepID=UPI0032C211AA
MPNKLFKIAIDAGHGPETKGKRSPDESLREFQFNEVVAYLVKNQLKTYEGVEIIFTHEKHFDVPLQERTRKANKWQADLFLSIHANAYGSDWNNVSGIETFVHTSQPKSATRLANAVQKRLVQVTKRKNRGVKSADFHVLRESNMTAILVECEFMTCKESCELLKSTYYRRLCAEAIVQGIVDTYSLQKKEKHDNENREIESSTLFQDVDTFRWSHSAIEQMAKKGLMNGYKDGLFRPSNPVTREELAVVLSRIMRKEE